MVSWCFYCFYALETLLVSNVYSSIFARRHCGRVHILFAVRHCGRAGILFGLRLYLNSGFILLFQYYARSCNHECINQRLLQELKISVPICLFVCSFTNTDLMLQFFWLSLTNDIIYFSVRHVDQKYFDLPAQVKSVSLANIVPAALETDIETFKAELRYLWLCLVILFSTLMVCGYFVRPNTGFRVSNGHTWCI